ncbi:hypothetical protein PAP_07240 [Palaeococcus pacificus DY20341]|uniref:Transglutaminase-like domain-containing protein n=1 Tax=Palaeococcus pacificus DY20341 TaxID=1343739 RepID=A0A075LZ47_9EURY|nr:transglutaminase domain-containing protein [Palaeococcus pacificus]AIF69838.1 hypothetical protein PAP_07240 [Palaeococcus pacificus DY20341]
MDKFKKYALFVAFLVLASGCIYKPPYTINFSLNKNVVEPGETFYITLTFNNTGKVAFVGMEDLSDIPDGFIVIRYPQFPRFLKVGESADLVWVLKAPLAPGTYPIKLRINFIDELHRAWFEYREFVITVVKGSNSNSKNKEGKLLLNFGISSSTLEGGEEFQLTLNLTNIGDKTVKVGEVNIYLSEGIELSSQSTLPDKIPPQETVLVNYTLKAKYMHSKGYITIFVSYNEGGTEVKKVLSGDVEVLWRPWIHDRETLKEAYKDKYGWIVDPYIVDGYWIKKYKAEITGDLESLTPYIKGLTEGAKSEVDAAKNVYNWIRDNYTFGDTTTALEPINIAEQRKISYDEGQILFVGMMRALNVPSRLVTLYNGGDCTLKAVSEFYSNGEWYVVDFERGFFGSRGEYIATSFFPRLYQMLTDGGYRLVAQAPEELKGHEHIDVTGEYTAKIKETLIEEIEKRTSPTGRIQLNKILMDMDENEQLFALFLLASAPKDELNYVLTKYSAGDIGKNIKTIHEFYKNKPYPDDFEEYWKILREGLG